MHVAGVYDGSQIKLYINGNLEASSSLNGVFSDEGLIKTFGHSSFIGSNHFFEGKIDEFSIWNIGLNESEIVNFMVNSCSREDGLVDIGILKREVVKQYWIYLQMEITELLMVLHIVGMFLNKLSK